MTDTNFQISGTDLNNYFLSDDKNSGSSASRNVYNTGFTTNSNDIDRKRFVLNDPAISKNNIGMQWDESKSNNADWACSAMNELGNRAVAAAWGGGIYYSTNYGVDWIKTNAPNEKYTGLAMSYDGNIVYACAGAGGVASIVRRSIDGGQTWVDKLYHFYFNGVACSFDGSRVIAVVYNDYIYYSSNYGDSWTQSLSAPAERWYSVSMSKTGQYAIATNNSNITSQVFYSSDYGATWTVSNGTFNDHQYSSMSASGKYAVIGTSDQVTAAPSYSTDYGKTWIIMTPSTNETSTTMDAAYYFKFVAMSGTGKEVLFTNASNQLDGYIYYSGCYGKNYAKTKSPLKPFKTISMSKNGMYAICGTYSGKIYVSKSIQTTGYNITKKITNIYDACASSSSWREIGNSPGTLATAISGDGSKIVLISTDRNFYVATTNYGINWTLMPNPSNVVAWNSVCISYNGEYIYALGTHNVFGSGNSGDTTRLYQFNSTSNTFTEKFNTTVLKTTNCIATSWNGKYVAFALNENFIMVSDNYGANAIIKGDSYSWSGIAMSADGKYITVTAGANDWRKTYQSYDYGSTFIDLNQGQTHNQRMGGMSDSGAIVLFGAYIDSYVLLSRTYNGTFYSLIHNTTVSNNFWNGAVSGTGQYMFVITTSNNISISQDYGNNWKTISWTDGYANTISISNSAESAVLTTSTGKVYYLSGNPVTVQMDLGLLYHKPVPFSKISYNTSCAYYPLANSFEEIYGNNTSSYSKVYEHRSTTADGFFYSDKLTFESAGGRYGLYLPVGTRAYWASVPFYPNTQTDSYTICFWIYLLRAYDGTRPDIQTIFSVYPGTINVDTNDSDNGWKIGMYMLNGNGVVAEKTYTNKDNLKTWNHVALKYQYISGTTATANLYLNGTVITNSNNNNRYNHYAASQSDRQMLIGTNADSSSGQIRRTNAYYRDLMLFSSALSDTEILDIYNYTI